MESPRTALTTRLCVIPLVAIVIIISQLTGCGLEGDERSPVVSSQTPAPGSIGVPTDSTVALELSEGLLTNTLTTASLTLTDNGFAVVGDLGYDPAARTLALTPTAPLALGTTYQASYGTGISDLAGNPVVPGSWTFTTVDGTWQPAFALSTTLSNASQPNVEVDDNGYGIAIWLESDGLNQAVHASHYVPGSGWNPPGIVDIFPLGDASVPVLDVNPVTGQAIVAWLENNGGTEELWATIYDPSIGWGTPVRANGSATNSVEGAPSVVISQSGIATTAWVENTGTVTQVWANQYDPTLGWGAPVLVQMAASENGLSPLLKGNAQDQVVLVWQQSSAAAQFNVYFSTLVLGSSWSTPMELDTTTDFALRGDVAINEAGNILVLWAQGSAVAMDIYSRWYTPTSGWSAPAFAATGNSNLAGQTQLILTDDNAATLLYLVGGTGVNYEIYFSEFSAATGWTTATVFAAEAGNDMLFPRLERNATGVMQAAWMETQGPIATTTESHIRQQRYRPGIGWEAAQTQYSATNELASIPRVALANSGETLLIWQQADGIAVTNILQRVFAE